MVISIHQPNFIPWIGYFHKIIHSDIFVLLDTVLFSKGSFTNRNKIKLSNGTDSWLTVPVITSKHQKQAINNVLIDYKKDWIGKHIKTFLDKELEETLIHFTHARDVWGEKEAPPSHKKKTFQKLT